MEKSLKTIKKLMKTIQTWLKTMGKWVKAEMLQIPCKLTILATHICDSSSEMLQVTCKMIDFGSKTQQVARKSEILAAKCSKSKGKLTQTEKQEEFVNKNHCPLFLFVQATYQNVPPVLCIGNARLMQSSILSCRSTLQVCLMQNSHIQLSMGS